MLLFSSYSQSVLWTQRELCFMQSVMRHGKMIKAPPTIIIRTTQQQHLPYPGLFELWVSSLSYYTVFCFKQRLEASEVETRFQTLVKPESFFFLNEFSHLENWVKKIDYCELLKPKPVIKGTGLLECIRNVPFLFFTDGRKLALFPGPLQLASWAVCFKNSF